MQRKYSTELRPEIPGEYSARIDYEGQHAFFPLGEGEREAAERKAETIRCLVARQGWIGGSRFVREFTLAIFWLPNPLTCTYATFFTGLRHIPACRLKPTRRVRVGILEPDDQVRRALGQWVNALPGYQCVALHSCTESFFRSVARARVELALLHDPPCAPFDERVSERFASEFPQSLSFPFGVYCDSDAAWMSVTGVDGGYYYRRRRPCEMLDPVSGVWQAQPPSRDSAESQIRNHVQTLFGFRAAREQVGPNLTQRERDVLIGLQSGYSDKTIAVRLAISTWTVHTHVKSLFEKLGVHSRAEAVAKCFQK